MLSRVRGGVRRAVQEADCSAPPSPAVRPLQAELDGVTALLEEAERRSLRTSKDVAGLEGSLQDTQVTATHTHTHSHTHAHRHAHAPAFVEFVFCLLFIYCVCVYLYICVCACVCVCARRSSWLRRRVRSWV